jgi:hypothetical protein
MRRDTGDRHGASTLEAAAPYPESGAVLIVSAHVTEHSVAPAVAGWQVVRLSATGEQRAVGGLHARRLAARLFAEATFGNIVGWQRLGATVLAARVPLLVAPVRAEVRPSPRRRANGLRLPLWRT